MCLAKRRFRQMGDFKQQFNNAFQQAPSFSTKARENVKRQLHQRKKIRWMPASIVTVAAVALISVVIWNDDLLGRFNEQPTVSHAAPEHEDKMEIFLEVKPDNITQFSITNQMNSMNRGNEEYKGGITIETQYDDVKYGQVLLLEDGTEDDVFNYVLGRVIGKPGDKVAIKDGQLYLNDLPLETFYGKAQIMGTTNVEEAFERLRKVNSTEWEESIEEALQYSLEPIILKEDELFIVSDNWARNSVRKTFTTDQIEGIVIGYNDVRELTDNQRQLNAEELKQFTELGKQVIANIKIENQSPHKIEMDVDVNYLNNEIVEHQIIYYSYLDIRSTKLLLKKSVIIAYYHKEYERNVYFEFSLMDGEWDNTGQFMEYNYCGSHKFASRIFTFVKKC